jgi:hypothetical protein
MGKEIAMKSKETPEMKEMGKKPKMKIALIVSVLKKKGKLDKAKDACEECGKEPCQCEE